MYPFDALSNSAREPHHVLALSRDDGTIGVLHHPPKSIGILDALAPSGRNHQLSHLFVVIDARRSERHFHKMLTAPASAYSPNAKIIAPETWLTVRIHASPRR